MAKKKPKGAKTAKVSKDLLEEASVGRQTLERTPERVLQFLRAIGVSIPIRSAMRQHGYTQADHQEGWNLLHATSGFLGGEEDPELEDVSVRDAIVALDEWDEDGLRMISATLRRRHPEVHAFVMRGLRPSTGAGSVMVVQTLLERLDALRTGKGRPADMRREDKAALATLATRKIDDAEIDRLRKLVKIAKSAPEIPTDDDVAIEAEHAYLQKLLKLREWYEEHAELARSVIKKRAHLLRLGLATRRPTRTNGGDADAPEDEEPARPSNGSGGLAPGELGTD